MSTNRFDDDNGRAGVPDEIEIYAMDFEQYHADRTVASIVDQHGDEVLMVYHTRGGYYKRIKDGVGSVSRPSAANEVFTVTFLY